MNYTSTRSIMNVSSAQAIASGIAPDGGPFHPDGDSTAYIRRPDKFSKVQLFESCGGDTFPLHERFY